MKKLLLLLLFFMLTPVAHAVTYATWNPSDKGTEITLSGGNLVATHSGAVSYGGVRGTIDKSTGKWYWEVTVTTAGNVTRIGAANATENINSAHGNNSVVYAATNEGVQNGGVPWTGATYTTGDVLGFALDADANPKTFKAYKNNALQGTFTDIAGDGNFPYLSFYSGGVATANFGATSMTYTAPTGYNQGLYTEDAVVSPPFLPWFFWPF